LNTGDRIQALREVRDLGKGELANLAGIAASYVGQLERNEKSPTVDVLEKLWAALEITAGEFFREDAGGALPGLLVAKMLKLPREKLRLLGEIVDSWA
jgi:transcriptional regulator with XRE-family HTH domain